MNNFFRLLNTVKYLKFKQIYFRIYYYFLKKDLSRYVKDLYQKKSTELVLKRSIQYTNLYANNKFIFLNRVHQFENTIDWNFESFGKLWTYNLNYFEYLNQIDITKEEGVELIYDFIDNIEKINDGLEAFPISLRGINWIKFLAYYKIHNEKINTSLYMQYQLLMKNIEYHLLGNHLLENGFALLFGAYYFQDETFYAKAKKILTKELEEQILIDGAHFELSPMYHQLMFFRVLDCINLVKHNNWKNQELLALLTSKAEIMLGWLHTITYENGNIPLLNDSANNIAPSTQELNIYADTLDVKMKKLKLFDSGYRKITNKYYEMIMDVGNIGPDYIPGHAHSDTFNFELYIDRSPFIVDTGISTYETNAIRTLERSTVSHNTVELAGLDQSEIWGSFRVANRAYITEMVEKENYIKSVHDGYKKRLNTLHQREFFCEEKNIKIVDSILSEKEHEAIARIHFYPGLDPIITNDGIQVDNIRINIKQYYPDIQEFILKVKEYNYAPQFNTLKKAKMLEILFSKKLEMEIIL